MSAPPGKKMGLSLYADFLEPDRKKAATISSAPVKYEMVKKAEAEEEAIQKRKDGTVLHARPFAERQHGSLPPLKHLSSFSPSSDRRCSRSRTSRGRRPRLPQ